MGGLALLLDYGEVICEPQPQPLLEEMAALCSLPLRAFVERYWEHRPPYDRGGAPSEFWAAVMDGAAPDRDTLARLVELDVASWRVLNRETLALLDEVRAAGASLSVLSNAPHELADALEADPMFSAYEHLLFSSRLGLVKPEAEIFAAAVARLGRPAEQILFVDDRAPNVEAALACGLDAVRFSSPEQLRRELLARR